MWQGAIESLVERGSWYVQVGTDSCEQYVEVGTEAYDSDA
jgi:hypothetical protein